MTKKNKTKTAARERQQKLGGKFLHHHRLVADDAPTSGLTVDALVRLARRGARLRIAEVVPMLSGQVTYLAVDPADAFGGEIARRILALPAASPDARVAPVRTSRVRAGLTKNMLLEFVSAPALSEILRVALGPTRIDIVVNLTVLFSAEPPPGHIHVFVAGAGEIAAALAPVEQLCWCGHAKSEHDESGSCTWLGVPDGRPMPGVMPDPSFVEMARVRGIPMRCCCGGGLVAMHDEGGIAPLELNQRA